MTKKFIAAGIYSLLAVVLISTFSACKKDAADGSLNITGKWVKTQFQGLQVYEFKSDSTVEYTVLQTDSVTKNIIGYTYKSIGKYSLKNAELKLYDLQNFSNSKNIFGPASELTPVGGAKTVTYTIALNRQKNKLSVFFTCPDGYDCVPSPIVYNKQ